MARRKAPQAIEAGETTPEVTWPTMAPRWRDAARDLWRDPFALLLMVLTAGAITAVWLTQPRPTNSESLPSSLSPASIPLALAATLCFIALLGLLGRVQARRTIARLEATLEHEEMVHARLQPDITREQSGLRMRHVSAWLVAILGAAAAALLWRMRDFQHALGSDTILVIGSTVSVMLALAVAANAINRCKARRLARDFKIALHSELLALGTLGSVEAMISAVLPTGERTRFNERYLQFTGMSAAQLQGRGWLEAIHLDDRQRVLDLIGQPLGPSARPRSCDMCLRRRDGEFAWVRETLVPRFNDRGELIEFISTVIDITRHVEAERAFDKQIGDLKADLGKAQEELGESRGELSKLRTSRNRFEKGLDEAREDVKNLQASLTKAEAALERIKADAAAQVKEAQGELKRRVGEIEEASEKRIAKMEEASEGRIIKLEEAAKSARQELSVAGAESRKLTRACEKLQEEIVDLRKENGELREQTARHIRETREAKAAVTDAHTGEASLRSRSDSLAKRCAELEAQLAAKDQEVAEARQQVEHTSAAAAEEVERRLHEVSSEALATHLRKQLSALQRATGEMLESAIDGPARQAVNNAAASVRAMSDIVDQALGGKGIASDDGDDAERTAPSASRSASPAPARATAFDLRRTADGVRDLLSASAAERSAGVEIEIAPKLPALVYGDEVALRTALMSLTEATLALVEDGSLTLRLSEDVTTAAHATIRCELRHASARVRNDALETALAMKIADNAMPDPAKQPLAHQAARAWQTLRALDGQHGYLLPDEGGFSVWFTFTLGRPGASAQFQAEEQRVREERPSHAAPSRSIESEAAASASSSSPSYAPSNAAADGAADGGPARPMPRMQQEFLNCNLGEVAELGVESVRVICSRAPKKQPVEISFEDGESTLDVRAEILWSKKMASRKYDVGLHFIGLTQADQKRLARIAIQHRKVQSMLGIE